MNHVPLRSVRALVAALSAAVCLTVLAASPAWASGDPFAELLEASLKERKGVLVYLKGQAVAGRVTRLTESAVELTSREYTRIVIRRETIDGVAMN